MRTAKAITVSFGCINVLLLMSFLAVQTTRADYLLRVGEFGTFNTGYVNLNGDTVIPLKKYILCYTDTFRTYAIVINDSGLVAINRSEKVLYKVHVFDNGPDYPKEGLFRIWKNGKMGYADDRTGKIILYPQFSAGFPFEKGVAKVSKSNCITESDGEHSWWRCDEWIYIDHTGKEVPAPK